MSMDKTPPVIEKEFLDQVEKVTSQASVKNMLDRALSNAESAMIEQIEICEIPAPTFKEEVRAKEIARRMKALGLTDVKIDEIGNVIGVRPGKLSKEGKKAPVVAMGAHMDTVFPEGTPIKVRKEGNVYHAPGIGDNCSGLRCLLQTLRAMQEANIETQGDLLFVGTVGEEGNGDIRGSKFLFDNNPNIDAFLAVDNTDVGRVLWGALGSHRWRFSFEGTGGHSFSAFGIAPSAIHAMGRAIAKVANLKVPEDPKTTYTVGIVSGGTSVNTIAPKCSCEVDMRSIDNAELLKLEARIMQCFDEALNEENEFVNATGEKMLKLVKTQIGDRPAGARPDNCPVIQASLAAQKALGIKLTHFTASSTDANKPVSMGIPATCLSAGGRQVGSHTVKEYFECFDIHLGPQLVGLTALTLAGVGDIAPILKTK